MKKKTIEKLVKRLNKENRKHKDQLNRIWGELIKIRELQRRNEQDTAKAAAVAKVTAEALAEVGRKTELHSDQIASLKDVVRKMKK